MRFRLSLLVLLTLTGCGAAEEERPTAGADDFGAPIPSGTAPERIVSLNPATTEILFALGAGSRLVGRTRWDSWPDSARLIPDLGDGIRPNVEAILARHPDLVILYGSADNRPAADRLTRAGVPVLALKVDQIADFRRAAVTLGAVLGAPGRAAEVVDSVERTLTRVQRATASREPVDVVWPLWDEPVLVVGGGSFLDELLEIAGGRNIYRSHPQPSPPVALEDIARRDPDVILTNPRQRPRILADPRWQVVKAVREGRVRGVDTLLTMRPATRLGEAAASLARLLHPDIDLP